MPVKQWADSSKLDGPIGGHFSNKYKSILGRPAATINLGHSKRKLPIRSLGIEQWTDVLIVTKGRAGRKYGRDSLP
jgi:hypothetical protein